MCNIFKKRKNTPKFNPKRVFSFGINLYKNGGNLNGCVNDSMNIANYITECYGFQKDNVRILLNERATKKQILDRLYWLTDDLKENDAILFHNSSHGAQIAERTGAGELDGLSEIVCCHDFNWEPDTYITDKEFVEIFKRVPKGAYCIWIADCCHSRNLNKNAEVLTRNYPLLPPQDILWRINSALSKKPLTRELLFDNSELNMAFLAGCQENGTSADAIVDGEPQGALTSYFIKTNKNNPNNTLQQNCGLISKQLKKDGYSQIPQADGLLSTIPVLGGLK